MSRRATATAEIDTSRTDMRLPPPLREGEIPIADIEAWADQPRRHLERGDRDGLTASVRQRGILQPLLLRPNGQAGRYQIVAGERRFRAAQAAGLTTVPARVFALSDHDAIELALLENIQRSDLHPVEEAETFARLQKLDKVYTDQALAERVGKSVAYVQRRKRLLSLPPVVREAFLADVITDAHAALIAKAPDSLKGDLFRECFLNLEGEAILLDRIKRRVWDDLRDAVAAPASVQQYLDRYTVQTLDEVQERLPELAAARQAVEGEGKSIVELSEDWSFTPSERKKFPTLLTREQYDEVGRANYGGGFGKVCALAERGVIVHGGRPRLLTFCRKGNDCPVHHKPYVSETTSTPGRTRGASDFDRQQRERQRKQRQYSLMKTPAMKAMAPLLLKATATPAIVKSIVKSHELADIAKRFGLTLSATNGLAVILANEAVRKAWDRSAFVAFGKLVGFDFAKFERAELKRKTAAKRAPRTGSATKARNVKKAKG